MRVTLVGFVLPCQLTIVQTRPLINLTLKTSGPKGLMVNFLKLILGLFLSVSLAAPVLACDDDDTDGLDVGLVPLRGRRESQHPSRCYANFGRTWGTCALYRRNKYGRRRRVILCQWLFSGRDRNNSHR